MAKVGIHFIKLDSRVLHGVCQQLGLTRETEDAFTAEPARSQHWDSHSDWVGIDPGVTQAVSTASGVWDMKSSQLVADQLAQWKLTKGQLRHASGVNNSRRDTERWLAPIQPHLQHLAAASLAGTSLEANLKHFTATLATWDAVWELYLDPRWARQRLRPYEAQDRALQQFFKKVTVVGRVRPKRTNQRRGRVVLVDEHRTSRVSSAVNGQQPSKRSKRTKAEPAVEPTQTTKGKGKAAKTKPAPQPGKWVDRDCNAALNMQRIEESRWRPLELCWWPEQAALPAKSKSKEYPELGYKQVRDKPP
ncbi:hypothetical protein QJQ45_000640 [Haematococcus lacustris]|nr:hypothetical protein QJQ45_000640 [Haematococcus lacustris]